MKLIVKQWLKQVKPTGQIPHRWECSRNIVAQSVLNAAVELGWATSNRVDDCWITDAGRAAIAAP